MKTVIKIENLYKEYRLGTIGYGTLREDFQSWYASIRNRPDPNSIIGNESGTSSNHSDHILALNNIQLNVKAGEKLGIIGKNGAGKTTLLKILSQIASPTSGSVKIKGRVASLIAVGTGMHPELTGKENIYLNGSILGLTKNEIAQRFDEIVDFSGVEKFLDTPVKRYSSGMFVRLGFSVAAHLDPDILVVDEVLAVGDVWFQKKAIGKMRDVSTGEGRTVLFVSHNLVSIENLCDNAILLDKGKIVYQGDVLSTIGSRYGEVTTSNTELNLNIKKKKQNINIGINALSDKFKEDNYIPHPLRNQEYQTLGIYINHLWDVTDKLALESGLRTDKVDASTLNTENGGQSFILPKISALYKLTPELSIRLGGGMGYRMPTIFNEEAEPYGYRNVQRIDFEKLVAEESYGSNIDFKYQSTFGLDNVLLSLNQMFFYNVIDNPITLNENDIDNLFYEQTNDSLFSKGYESQIKLTVGKFTWFFGYTYTDAYLENGAEENPLTLTPKHSIKGDLLFVVEDKWRIGWDYDYKSGQFLIDENEPITESLFTTGVIVERTIDNFVIFLNAENFTDVRQSNTGSVLTDGSPQFTEVWAPLDGYFFNAGLKIKL